MDSSRFDDLSRALANTRSRRAFATLLGGFVPIVLTDQAATKGRGKKGKHRGKGKKKPPCHKDFECPRATICKHGDCVPPECLQDFDCGEGQMCDVGHCVSGCKTSANCPPYSTCRRGSCGAGECDLDQDCPTGKFCNDAHLCYTP